MIRLLNELKSGFEYLGGVTGDPPESLPKWLQSPLWWGIWWAALILLILIFSGQTSKFIYIDF
jgi:hypothetical protein